MTINIQYVKMPFSESMTEYVIEKLNKLGERYQWIVQAKVFFKRENDPSGNGKICEIELSMPGPNVFASSRENNFELAAKETTLEIERQLKKRKAVLKAH
ncbi:MAG TPA: ribosome-associated translation inhibitor RaiA [Gillisia sp.]|nr:ribosome-associated translation inhibitor RaiA [Gillisia sp.]HSP82857.1 ribosome-associated translation inhibitor RaiA [Gillisia sp.]